jgi:hypothetical protein
MMNKFLRRLLGGDTAQAGESATAAAESEVYEDFELTAAPIKESGGWRIAGQIAKGAGEARRTHDFVRADVFPSQDDAVQVTLRKARQLVDERGDKLFD